MRIKEIFQNITVEPVLFMSAFIMSMSSNLSSEYIFQYFAIQHGLKNASSHTTDKSCNASTSSNSSDHTLNIVSSETSKWVLYLNCAGLCAACFSSTLLGVWSDKVGRKPALLFCNLGFVVFIAIYCVTIQFTLPVYVLLIARLICGLLGDYPCILGTTFAVISDISNEQNRTLRMAIGEASLGVGGIIAFFISGIWVSNEGYEIPFYCMFVLSALNLLYIQIRLKMDRPLRKEDYIYLLKLRPLMDLYYAVKNSFTSGNLGTVLLLLLCFGLNFIYDLGISDVLNVYELSEPFCMSLVLVGFSYALVNLGMLLNIPVIHLFKGLRAEFCLGIIGAVGMIGASMFLALSHVQSMIYIAFIFALFSRFPAPILRSQMSRLVDDENQGSLFSVIAALSSVMALAASFMYNGLYSFTAKTGNPGSVFYIGVACGVLYIPIYYRGYLSSRQKMINTKDSDYKPLSIQEQPDINATA